MKSRIITVAALMVALITISTAQAWAHPRLTLAHGKTAIRRIARSVGENTGADRTMVYQCDRERSIVIACIVNWSYVDTDGSSCTASASARYVGNIIRVRIPSWSLTCAGNVAPGSPGDPGNPGFDLGPN